MYLHLPFCKCKKVQSLIGTIALAIVLCVSIPASASATTFLGMEVSGKSAQANISGFFNTLSIRVFCGLTGLFANTCEEQGIGQSGTTSPQNVVTVQNTSVVAVPAQPVVTPAVQVTGADVRQTVVERIIERVVSPVGIAGVSQEYVDGRLAALAAELRDEMTDRTITVRTSSGSSGDNFSRQVDSIYDDMSENINEAIEGLQTEDQVLTLIAANSTALPVGTAGYILQATGTTTQWVATSTLGFASAGGDWTGTFDGQASSFYLARANHSGTQTASTISDFSSTARGLFSSSVTGLTYTSGTGTFSLTSGYEIPTTASTTEWTSKVSSQWTTSGSNISYTAGNVGIGTTTPGAKLHALATTEQLRLGYSASNYLSMTVGSTGLVTLNAVGTGSAFTFSGDVSAPNISIGSFNINGTTGLFNGTAQTANSAYLGATSGAVLAVNNGSNYVYDDNANALSAVYANNAGSASYATYGASSSLTLAVNNGGYVYDDLGTALSAAYADNAGVATNASSANTANASWGQFFVGGGFFLDADNNPVTGISLGSASVPSVSFTSDTNTGIWSPAADTLAFSTAGSERLRITSGGNVGIGTTTPAAKLAITGTAGTGDIFAIASSTNARLLTVTSAGNIGIGTSNPEGILSINSGNAVNDWIQMGNESATASKYIGLATGASFGANLGFSGIEFGPPAGTGEGYLAFHTHDAGVSSGEKMRIDKSGNVGIGTTTPVAKLAITGTAGTGDIFAIASSTNARLLTVSSLGNVGIGTDAPAHKLHLSDSVNNFQMRIGGTSTFNYDMGRSNFDGYFNFYGNRTAAVGYVFGGVDGERMRLTFAGDLGIGTTTPGARLNVVSRSVASTTAMFAGFSSGQTADILQLAKNPGATPGLIFSAGGSLGIGTTTPTAQLHTTGTVRFSNFAAGTLMTDADGNVTASSDERLKNIEGNFDRGLEDLLKIQTISYKWKTETGYDTDSSYAGFSAQNVQLAIPEAISTNTKGMLSLSDRPILATVVNAIRDLSVKFESMAAWFTGGRFNVQSDICVDDVCVTKEEFKDILRGGGGNRLSPTLAPMDDPDPVPEGDSSGGTEGGSEPVIDGSTGNDGAEPPIVPVPDIAVPDEGSETPSPPETGGDAPNLGSSETSDTEDSSDEGAPADSGDSSSGGNSSSSSDSSGSSDSGSSDGGE